MLVFALLALCLFISGSADDVTKITDASSINVKPTTAPPNFVTENEGNLDTRLPRSLRPLHYLIKLQPFVNGNFSIHGYVEVEMEVLEPTYNITLNMFDIITKNDTVKVFKSGVVSNRNIRIEKQEYDHSRQFYIAHLKEELQQGNKYVLAMEFVGYLNDQMLGFYRSSYTDASGSIRNLASTQFSPTNARRAFPCFDEPALKATFEVHLAREKGMTSLSNMPIAKTLPVDNQEGWMWDCYQKSVKMSTFLVAFAVTDFAYIDSSKAEGVQFKVWARKSVIDDANYASKIGPKILKFFEEYFNTSFPLPKQDVIAMPDLVYLAMENFGLITVRESHSLYNPKVSIPGDKEEAAVTVAHELAHQWFGNLVTPTWWDEGWLNEGFATYMSYLVMDYVEPSWQIMEKFIRRITQPIFDMDSLESSHKLSVSVVDSISYKKGASIVRMMSHFLNEATFKKGLSYYLQEFKYSNADQNDLWEYLTVAAHEDGTLPRSLTVKQIMDTWTLQKGFPVVQVTRTPDGTAATISQERFLLEEDNNSTDTHDYKWWVPLTYTTEREAKFNETQAMAWLENSSENLTIASLPPKDQWVIFNLQETGYYRVNYDDHNWNLLIQQLKNDHEVIHAVNRAQIIDDAMNLAKAGHLSYKIAIGVFSYLSKETEYLPWSVAVNKLSYIETMFERTGAYGAFKRYVLSLVLPLYESMGFEEKAGEPYLEQKKRWIAVEWACKMGHEDCLQKSVAKYRQWMKDPRSMTFYSPNLIPLISCAAIAEGGEAEWDFAWNVYLQSDVASEKAVLLRILTCSKDIWILSRYLETAVTPDAGVKPQDLITVLLHMSWNEVGRPIVWDYLMYYWNDLFTYKKKMRGNLMNGVAESFNTKQDLRHVENLVNNSSNDLEGNLNTVLQVIEKVKNNIAWMDKNYDAIVEWMAENGFSSRVPNVLEV